jgi:hypothetical protein
MSFAGPGLHCFKIRAAGWVTGHVHFWAGLELVVGPDLA